MVSSFRLSGRRPSGIAGRRLVVAGTATLLATGGVVGQSVVSRPGISVEAAAAAANTSAGSWSPVATMGTRRAFHTATLLASGAVLVTGGLSEGTEPPSLATTEIYRPWSDTWAPAAPMRAARSRHTATLLPNNRVLVIGGRTAEIYTPWTNTWRTVASPEAERDGHSATLLYDGRVIVVGTTSTNAIEEAPEIYDYMRNTWTTVDSPGYAVGGICGARMSSDEPSGAVVAGGCGFFGGSLSGAAQFGAGTNEWTDVDDSGGIVGDESSAATVLQNGNILVSGGECLICSTLDKASIYSPRTRQWTQTGDMRHPRRNHTLTTLDSGNVLAVGDFGRGEAASQAEIYRVATRTWHAAGTTSVTRAGHTATLLDDDRVLVTGGIPAFFDRATDSAEAFRPGAR